MFCFVLADKLLIDMSCFYAKLYKYVECFWDKLNTSEYYLRTKQVLLIDEKKTKIAYFMANGKKGVGV